MSIYIHELPDWPRFRWKDDRLVEKLANVRHHQGRLLGRMEGLGFKLREEATLQTLTEEAVKTSEIEGEVLDATQVRSSLARRMGLQEGALTTVDRNVEGIVEVILDATRKYAEPLTDERLFGWHAALFPTGWSGSRRISVAKWRSESIEVVSGPEGKQRVHFEGPDEKRVSAEMAEFIKWFNDSDAGIDPVLKAAIAHFWFVTIHPFEDGNGRIARAIADMALARSEKTSQRFYSVSAQIRRERNQYYDCLEETQKGDLDITGQLAWFLDCLERAFDGADETLSGVLDKAGFWKMHNSTSLNDRQRKVANLLLDNFEGKLTSSKWAKLTKSSQATAGRDIDELLQRHILAKEPGRGRSTSYALIASVSDVLKLIAEYIRLFSDGFVQDGPNSLNGDQKGAHRTKIEKLATEIDALADAGKKKKIAYGDFQPILGQLHKLGFFPDDNLISALAFMTKDNL